EEPLNPLGRTTFWIIIILIFFTILWLFFGKVDIVVTARGKIIPDGEIKIIQPLETGVVKNILAKEGDFVKKGQALIELDSSTTKPELDAIGKNLSYIKTENERLNALANGGSYETDNITQQELYKSTIKDLRNQLKAKRMEANQISEQINSAQTEKDNYTRLLALNLDKEQRMNNVIDIIAYNEIEKVKMENMNYRTNISTLNNRITELRHQRNKIIQEANYIKSNFKTQSLTQLTERELKEISLESDIEQIKFRNQKQIITSPVDGYVNTMLIHTIGGVVTPAKELLTIVPVNTPLCAKVSVLNKDVGFVKEGMPVQIKIDTFDFQKYGMLEGVVTKISKDSVEDEKQGLIYDVFISPNTHSLQVDGNWQEISTGMGLSAEIKTGKRRIIEFFIYPIIKYWSEAVSIK
ncbi:MAG: HlyD family type I secretion periplasmic adaptor subunit, partial [Candidatus Gastranaerophilales bacterium]|nr:HlyD family type I secretion periplasmic adaptor subunit [Candidatus Gastranaerophilales bacterium]